MPDLIRNLQRFLVSLLLIGAAAVFVSCAQEKPALVNDPDAKHEGALPWNQREKWETEGNLAGGSDRR